MKIQSLSTVDGFVFITSHFLSRIIFVIQYITVLAFWFLAFWLQVQYNWIWKRSQILCIRQPMRIWPASGVRTPDYLQNLTSISLSKD